MSTKVPIISVTGESKRHEGYEHHYTSTSSDDSDDSYSNDMDYNQNFGGLTDVEDFDSSADAERSRKLSRASLTLPKDLSNAQGGDATDVEDYNDSEADEEDEKSAVYPELKLSLQEFLQNDFQEQLSNSNGAKTTVELKSGNFLKAQNLNAIEDYLTDYEDYNTDSEIEKNCEKSACLDLADLSCVDQGSVNIADSTLKRNKGEESDCDNDDNDISLVSDISGLALSLSEAADYKDQRGMSEDEILELSNEEEVCQISCSDSDSISNAGNISEEGLLSGSSLPPIDVTFVHTFNKSKLGNGSFGQGVLGKGEYCRSTFLEVEPKAKLEVLTDIERFDDSAAEGEDDDSFDGDDENQQPIPQAVVFATDDDAGCATDCDDLLCDDNSEAASSAPDPVLSVDLSAIPLPQREFVVLQEDKFGDTITSVMPMDKEYQFGIYTALKDECLTETEEYSYTDDLDEQISLADLHSCSPSPQNVIIESDVTIANEMLKTQQSKRLETMSNTESVTDVEEIYMAGTNSRKKKLKPRSVSSKSKSRFLETPKSNTGKCGGGTDIEDMELSDSELLTAAKTSSKIKINRQLNHSPSEKVTDIEDITADDVSSVSEAELPLVDTNLTNLKDYDVSSKNIVVTLETCGSMACPKPSSQHILSNSEFMREGLNPIHNIQQPQTDIEDIQLPSDAEECVAISAAAVDTICPELNEMLNESCTTVHEKCINSFNIDAEKLHIKGMMLRESHTDIEYVESDESTARGSK